MNEKIQQKRAKSGEISFKNLSSGFKELDSNEHIIEIKFAAFGVKDSDDDILIKGCFSKSFQERGPESSTNRKIVYVWQHDIKDPIGKVLKLEEREDGAYATIRLSNFDAVPNAKRCYHQLMDGDINQFSFGFNYIWDKMEYDEEEEAYIIKEVKLFEISCVTLGANEETEFIGELKEENVEAYIKALKDKDKEMFNHLKQAILEIEAEPQQALTLNEKSMFEKLSEIKR